ncbi:unnamed protein product [Amaranthus hypochondriacus]
MGEFKEGGERNGFQPLRKAFRTQGESLGSKEKVPKQPAVVEAYPDEHHQLTDPQQTKAVSMTVSQKQNAYIVQQPAEEVELAPPSAPDPHRVSSVDASSLSPKVVHTTSVRHTSLSLHNEFNVLSVDHHTSEIDDTTIVIALGADPIGCND